MASSCTGQQIEHFHYNRKFSWGSAILDWFTYILQVEESLAKTQNTWALMTETPMLKS